MRVELWVRTDLTRRPDGARAPLTRLAEWDDPDARTARQAAERAWRVCAHSAHTLSPLEREWREGWDAAARGYGLGVGDVVVVDGRALRCEPTGFAPTELPDAVSRWV